MALVSYVEAIEQGKIVQVSEEYAKREGLLVLRKHVPTVVTPTPRGASVRARPGLLQFDQYRKPLKTDDLRASLFDTFHWELSKQRRLRNWTRKHVAEKVHAREEDIKLLETGVLGKDFVLLSKLEQLYGVNLRKSGSYLPRALLAESTSTPSSSLSPVRVEAVADAVAAELSGSEIELDDTQEMR